MKAGGSDRFSLSLLEWRNTPRADGFSPAQLFFGRRQRTLLPTLPGALDGIDLQSARDCRRSTTITAKANKDLHSVTQTPLNIGDRVRVQNPISGLWDECGHIKEICDHGRSYIVILEDDREYRRNRRFLKLARQANRGPEPTPSEETPDTQGSQADSACNPPTQGKLDNAPRQSAPATPAPPPAPRRSNRLRKKAKSVNFRL